MKSFLSAGAAITAFLLAPTVAAQLPTPGSVLIYPAHRSGPGGGTNNFTVLSVTNTSTLRDTKLKYNYVNTVYNPVDPQLPLDCYIVDRIETLTPADTLSVLTSCHNAAIAEGYALVSAQSTTGFDNDWSFNHLVGSELVVTGSGLRYSVNAIPFKSPQFERSLTDSVFNGGDGDGQLDFDGLEYGQIPETLYIDTFMALQGSALTLINMTGGTLYTTLVQFNIWNDNEQALSATKIFKCWFEQPLTDVSNVFSESFLSINTPHDPSELDINCDNVGDLETGWATINGVVTNSTTQAIPNPALLGAITNGNSAVIEGGRLLWGSDAQQGNGDFVKFSVVDSEYPCNPSLGFVGLNASMGSNGVVFVNGRIDNTGSSPVLGIELTGSVPLMPFGSLNLGTIHGPVNLAAGQSSFFSAQLLSPGPNSLLQLTATGEADSACGLGPIIGMQDVTLP